MVEGDSDAHTWKVTVVDGGLPVDLTGYAIAVHIDRRDGTDLVVTGTASGNVASVTLPQAAYSKPGRLVAVMRATKGEQEVTLAAACWNVTGGPRGTIVVQTDVVPDIDQLLAQLGNLRKALADTNAATAAANKAKTDLTTQVNTKVGEMTTLGNNLNTKYAQKDADLDSKFSTKSAALDKQFADKATALQGQVDKEITQLENAAMSVYVQGTDGKQYKGLLKNVDGKPVYEYTEV